MTSWQTIPSEFSSSKLPSWSCKPSIIYSHSQKHLASVVAELLHFKVSRPQAPLFHCNTFLSFN